MNLHEWGDEKDCFTKEDLSTLFVRSITRIVINIDHFWQETHHESRRDKGEDNCLDEKRGGGWYVVQSLLCDILPTQKYSHTATRCVLGSKEQYSSPKLQQSPFADLLSSRTPNEKKSNSEAS
jgi:hypothetical protein